MKKVTNKDIAIELLNRGFTIENTDLGTAEFIYLELREQIGNPVPTVWQTTRFAISDKRFYAIIDHMISKTII